VLELKGEIFKGVVVGVAVCGEDKFDVEFAEGDDLAGVFGESVFEGLYPDNWTAGER